MIVDSDPDDVVADVAADTVDDIADIVVLDAVPEFVLEPELNNVAVEFTYPLAAVSE